MELYADSRPTLNSRPALASGPIVPDLSFFPLRCGRIRVSATMPVDADSIGYGFTCKRYDTSVDACEIPQLMLDYSRDPEAVLERLFVTSSTRLHPALRIGRLPQGKIVGSRERLELAAQRKAESLARHAASDKLRPKVFDFDSDD